MERIGETLKKARELREIDLREISDATKISIRYLEAIESNRFDELPGGVFTKGFIRAYANYIGLDGQAMVDHYVDDIEAGPLDTKDADPHPPGLHRPAEIPHRRNAPDRNAETEHADNSDPPNESSRTDEPAMLHFTGLQIVSPDSAETDSTSGEGPTLPRIVWLVVATGLLFCILAAVKYMVVDPRATTESEQARLAAPPSVSPRPDTLRPAADAVTNTALASPGTTIAEDESSTAGGGVAVASPQSGTPLSAADDAAQAGTSEPHSSEAEDDPPDVSKPDRQAVTDSQPRALEPPDADADSMTVTITARSATRVRVVCDGRQVADRKMERGAVESLRCSGLIRLSAPDAANILLAVNGSECLPLGKPGSRLYGYVIRPNDYRTLCPDPMEGADVTR